MAAVIQAPADGRGKPTRATTPAAPARRATGDEDSAECGRKRPPGKTTAREGQQTMKSPRPVAALPAFDRHLRTGQIA